MLPSGNDAAVAIAEFVGRKIYKTKQDLHAVQDPMRAFLGLMNSTAINLGMFDSFFANPHGMSIPKNKSSAYDVCLLASAAVKNTLFLQIASTKVHNCSIIRRSGTCRAVQWENTNKLLGHEFCGLCLLYTSPSPRDS